VRLEQLRRVADDVEEDERQYRLRRHLREQQRVGREEEGRRRTGGGSGSGSGSGPARVMAAIGSRIYSAFGSSRSNPGSRQFGGGRSASHHGERCTSIGDTPLTLGT
jgi:hypothetical protein